MTVAATDLAGVVTKKELHVSDHFAQQQLVFDHPKHAFVAPWKPFAVKGRDHSHGTANPYFCRAPFVGGTQCHIECQWRYTTECQGTAAAGDVGYRHPYRFRQMKSFVGAAWSTLPAGVEPECCSVSTHCAHRHKTMHFHSEANPSIIEELSSSAESKSTNPSASLPTLPFDGGSATIETTCKLEGADMVLMSRSLSSTSATQYSRWCQFRDANPHHGQLSGADADCRGPSVMHVKHLALVLPMAWATHDGGEKKVRLMASVALSSPQ